DIGQASVSPDGGRIAFVGTLRGTPIRSYSQPDLWVVDASPNSTPKNLTEKYDYDVASGIGGDQAAPRGTNRQPIVWSSDGPARHNSSPTSTRISSRTSARANPRRSGTRRSTARTCRGGS